MLSIFFIGLALSMDAFSIALGIGLSRLSNFKRFLIPIVVGIFHFFMPLCGNLLGDEILNIINIHPKLIVGKYSSKYLKERAVYVGIFILLILSIVNLCQVFKI